jgi:prepilin-type N-terminal cleavage/methylation domain-containing protein
MHFSPSLRKAFTLIELLVVIAIIAILSVVVILTLNPAELLRQSRDANRLSDASTMANALNIYSTDLSGASSFNMGTPSTTYISIPDVSTVTSTAGDQCQGLGLPTLSSGWNYHCSASSTPRVVNGIGWIPVDFSSISSGAPFGSLPTDSTNQTSSNLYYTYATDGTKYVVTTPLESQKYLKQYLLTSNTDPTRIAQGSNISLVSQSEGLVGYWPMDEGNGSTTVDQSGNGASGVWTGTATGTKGYYSAGKIGSWAGTFDGTSTNVTIANVPGVTLNTVSAWVYLTSAVGASEIINDNITQNHRFIISNGNSIYDSGTTVSVTFPLNTWTLVSATYDGATIKIYMNGALVGSGANSKPISSGVTYIGSAAVNYQVFSGLIDDVRLYNRALSAGEIQAMYNAEK